MSFTQTHPSPAYAASLADARQHHRTAKTWSGGLMVRHAGAIRAMIQRLEIESVLDYGCGKCLQYFAPVVGIGSMEEYLGVPVFKMDPAVPADFRRPPGMPADYRIATDLPPDTSWDLVICTHVLGSIPLVDLRDWVVPLLHSVARKGIFLSENLGRPKKDKLFRVTDDKPREWTAAQWMELMRLPGSDVEVEGWFRGTPGQPSSAGPTCFSRFES